MRRSLAVLAMVGLGCSLAAAPQQAPDGQTVTVSGCLERAQRNGSAGGTVVGTSASPSTADDEANSGVLVDAFMLTEAVPASSGAASPSTTAGNDAPATGTSGRITPTAYGLIGHEAQLSDHTGAKVEVTGTVVPPATSGRGSGKSATASGVQRVRVASFKVLADRCSTK